MLKTETIKRIADILKIKQTDLEAALKDEKEVDVDIDEKLSSFTEKEVTTLKKNSYEDGKKAGVEMEVDELKKSEGLDFKGKTITALLEAKSAKVLADAKIEPDKKEEQYKTQITTLKKTIQEHEETISKKDAEVATSKTNSELYKYIPAPNPEKGYTLGQDDVIGLMKVNGYEPKLENGKTVFYKGGERVNNKLGDPEEANAVVSGFMKDKGIGIQEAAPIGGRGKGDTGGAGKAAKLSELKQKFESEGKNLLGEEFSKVVAEAAKDKDFDMNG